MSGAANVYDVTVAIDAIRWIGEVSDQGDHLSLARSLDVSRQMKDFPLFSAPGSGFCLRTTFIGFASQKKMLNNFPMEQIFRLIFCKLDDS